MKALRCEHEDEIQKLHLQNSREDRQRALLQLQRKGMSDKPKEDQEDNLKLTHMNMKLRLIMEEQSSEGESCLRTQENIRDIHQKQMPPQVLRYKEQSEPKVCSTHRDKLATLQCISCVKLKIPAKDSYYCSTKCFINSWKTHLQRHHYKTEKIKETSTDDKQTVRKIRSCGSWPEFSSEFLIGERAVAEEGNKWILVGCSKNYVPKIDDLGLNLKLECVAVDILTDTALSEMSVIVTDHVMEFPLAKPRRMVQIRHQHEYSNLCSSSFNGITFSILSYNILSDLYTVRRYRHCPRWALAWEYRRQNLLREIIDYDADIICLQEMQSDHFESFLKPELTKKGYLAIYKKRTNEVYTANQYVTDGCATFYQCDLFKEVMKYEIEFNKKTSPVVEALKPELRNEASIRLKKDNVALVVILETLESCHTYDAFRSSVCVVPYTSYFLHLHFTNLSNAYSTTFLFNIPR